MQQSLFKVQNSALIDNKDANWPLNLQQGQQFVILNKFSESNCNKDLFCMA